jgi:hypothetical protein
MIHNRHDLLRLCKLSSGTGNICIFPVCFSFSISVIRTVLHLILLAFRSAIEELPVKHQSTNACRISRDIDSARFNRPLNVDITTG